MLQQATAGKRVRLMCVVRSVTNCSNERMRGCNHLFAVVKNVMNFIHERIYSGDTVDTLEDLGTV